MGNAKRAIVNAVRTETHKWVTEDGVYTAVKRYFPSGMEISLNVKIPWATLKADLKPCLQEMTVMKWPQKTMAFVTDMSQGYVSKLLR